MPKYTVQRNTGFPVDEPTHAFGETFEAEATPELAHGVEQGYLSTTVPAAAIWPHAAYPAPAPEPDSH